MDTSRDAAAARPRVLEAIVLTALAIVIVVERLHTFFAPPHPDVNFYAVMGHALRDGRSLYSDLWDNRPPGTNLLYAAAEAIVGDGPRQLFALSVASALTSLLAVWAAGRWTGPAGGLLAAALWAILCGDFRIEGNQPNAEAFIDVFRAAAFAAVVRGALYGGRTAAYLFAGTAIAAATFVKQFTAVDAASFAVAAAATGSAKTGASAIRDAVALVLPSAFLWAVAIAYFSATSRGGAFWEAMVTYNRFYATGSDPLSHGLFANLVASFEPRNLWRPDLRISAWLAAAAALGLVLAWGRSRRVAALFLAWLVATHLEVALPGKFYAHYYQLWLPPLAVGAGWGAALLAERGRMPRVAATALGTLLLAAAVRREIHFYRIPGPEWTARRQGPAFVDLGHAATAIDRLLRRGEAFYVLGNEIGLYRETKRRPPTGVLYGSDVVSGPMAAALADRVIGDLERERPELVVVPRWVVDHGATTHPVRRWCFDRYRPIAVADPTFAFYARRRGRLERQLPPFAGTLGPPAPR